MAQGYQTAMAMAMAQGYQTAMATVMAMAMAMAMALQQHRSPRSNQHLHC
jgi:hypothetical protein